VAVVVTAAADAAEVVRLLHATADAVIEALGAVDDWGLAGTVPGQYRPDLVADAAALGVLVGAGVAVLSEESGWRRGLTGSITVVLDPLDGSTNAHRRLPWYATSLCAVDGDGPLAAVVMDVPGGRRFEAVRGGGARCDGVPIAGSGCEVLGEAVIALSGWPPHHLGWRQYRALGACALDLCAVAAGALDAFVDCSMDAHGPWDYLGGMLVCLEAGTCVGDAHGRDLVAVDHAVRRTPVAAATPTLLESLLAARRSFP
jgi:myo-inositol-1(or 4)-monophosphatase